MQVGEPVAEPRTEVQQRARRHAGHPGVAVGGAGGDALEQAEHAAHLRHRVERGDEVHLARARVREARRHAGVDERADHGLRAVHGPRSHVHSGVETWDAIRARRNVRTYTDQPIDAADLDRILEAGWRSPSASNRQKWDFVVVTDREQLAELGTVWQGARHIPGSQATIVLAVPTRRPSATSLDRYDLGQATMAMMIAAADLGIGSGHSSVGDQEAMRRILGFPEGHTAVAMIGLGYPADGALAPGQADRRPFDEVVHRGTW